MDTDDIIDIESVFDGHFINLKIDVRSTFAMKKILADVELMFRAWPGRAHGEELHVVFLGGGPSGGLGGGQLFFVENHIPRQAKKPETRAQLSHASTRRGL